jgi:hypothetical protein
MPHKIKIKCFSSLFKIIVLNVFYLNSTIKIIKKNNNKLLNKIQNTYASTESFFLSTNFIR